MESVEMEALRAQGADEDYRVPVPSKKRVTEQINRYKELLRAALDGQPEAPELPEDTRRELLQELLANFEAAVQENVSVNGRPWDEAPDTEEGDEDLDSLLDDSIVEATWRRRTYPRKILPHVVRSLKAERKLLGLYEVEAKPQEALKDPDQESIMSELSASAPGMVKQAIQVIKSINTLQKEAEGLCEVLNMTPSEVTLEIQRQVFGFGSQSVAPTPLTDGTLRNRQPIKRAVEEAAAADCYVPLSKKR